MVSAPGAPRARHRDGSVALALGLVVALAGAAACGPAPPPPDLQLIAAPDRVALHPDPAHADAVDRWIDPDHGVEAVSGATPEAKPRYVDEAIGGRGALRFGGHGGLSTGPLPALDRDELCAFVVGRHDDGPSSTQWLLAAAYQRGAGGAAENDHAWYLARWPDDRERAHAPSAAADDDDVDSVTPGGVTSAEPHLWALCWTADDTVTLYRDGRAMPAGEGADGQPAGHLQLYIGTGGGHQALRGEIAEVRVYHRALDRRARRAVEDELAARYGLSLER